MRELSIPARGFVVCVYLLGAAAAASAWLLGVGERPIVLWEYAVYLVLGIAAGSRKVRLIPRAEGSEAGSISLSFALGFAAVLRFGPVLALPIGIAATASACLYPRRQPLYQLAFNVCLSLVATLLTGLAYESVLSLTHAVGEGLFPALVSGCLTYFLINSGSVALIIALATKQSPVLVWQRNFLWTAPSYFVGAAAGYLAVVARGHNVFYLVLFGFPVAYLTYKSLAIYTGQAEQMRRSKADLADLYLATIRSLALAIDAKDAYTHQHILRVQRYAVAIAQKLGIGGDQLEAIKTGALLHDIGKLGVPEYVLLKPGPLTEEEFARIKEHPRIGADILAEIPFPWPLLPAVKHHHEKWDGTGYPDGLAGEQIPLQARILAVADVYDALTSARSYRDAWSHESAVEQIRSGAGTHFDPTVVEAFLEVVEDLVRQMSREGHGPLAVALASLKPVVSQADRAVQAIQRSSSELWALYEVAQTLSSSLGLNDTILILAGKLEAILPGTACVFLMREEKGENLVARAAVGPNREFFQSACTVDQNSRSWVVAHTKCTYMGGYDKNDLMLKSSPTAQWTPLGTALIVPIVHQGEVLGTANLYHTMLGAFTEHDRQLLETIADRAAMALYNGLLYERTRSHAETDTLTNLYNARFLTHYVDLRCQNYAEMRAESDAPVRRYDRFALLCLDLDSFKPINDLYGHQTGDRVLSELAALFRFLVRDSDVVARYGGDEFLIVLEGCDRLEAEAFASRIKERVAQYDTRLTHPRLDTLRLGVSIGVACFPEDGQDTATLLSAADGNMYRNKAEQKLRRLSEGTYGPEPEIDRILLVAGRE